MITSCLTRIPSHSSDMDPMLYRAAVEGQVDTLRYAMNGNTECDRTPNGNTVLHVATLFGHLKCVEVILEKCPDLLNRRNSKGETALHIAARDGDFDRVAALIDCAKIIVDPESAGGTNNTGGLLYEMLRAVNEDGDTALHLAARHPFSYRVMWLLTEGDPEFQHPPNNAQETPLYLACEKATHMDASAILENCRSPAYSGPGGKTALHAAVINISLFRGKTRLLLNWMPYLVQEPDVYGWTPIHYAARVNNMAAISELLTYDRSVAYNGAHNDDNKTALHIAAAEGFVEVMEAILSCCPDCWEQITDKRQNIFHISVKMQRETSLKYLDKQIWSKHLLNQKDSEGNTPLHLLASWTQKRIPFLHLNLLEGGDWEALNHANLTPFDIALTNDIWSSAMEVLWKNKWKKGAREEDETHETLQALVGRMSSTTINAPKDRPVYVIGWTNMVKNDRERMKKLDEKEKMIEEAKISALVDRYRKVADPLLIVATLIATVTFAATFTLPGGYDTVKGKNQGTAILLKKAVFKIFVISNTIAVVSATASVFLQFTALLYDDKDNLYSRYRKSFWLISIAIGAMVLAFVTGVYVVLVPSLSLAIINCVIGSLFFLIFLREFRKLNIFSDLWFLMKEGLPRRMYLTCKISL